VANSLCFSACLGALEERFRFADFLRFSGCSGVPEGFLGFGDSLRFSGCSDVLEGCLAFGDGDANPPPNYCNELPPADLLLSETMAHYQMDQPMVANHCFFMLCLFQAPGSIMQ